MMKKSIFAVAVASALTVGAAQAETVLYGSIRYDYESKKIHAMDDNQGTLHKLTSNRVSNLSDAGSRIGLKGSEDLGNNFAVIYNLEYGFDGMTQDESKGFKTRKAILGLTSDYGTFTAGRQDNPFKVTIVDDSVQDDFNGSSVITNASQRAMTSALKAQNIGPTTVNAEGDTVINTYDADFSRVGKVIAYTTPDFAGFQANAAVMMDSDMYETNSRKNADLWTINAKYAYDLGADGQILAKLGYIQGKVSGREHMKNSSKVWGLYLGYLSDAIKVSASYADGTQNHIKGQIGPKAKSKGWDLGASYSFGPNYFSTVRATYGQSELKVEGIEGGKDKVKSWAIGFEQKLSTRTRAWVEYGNEETKYHESGADKKKDNVISIGMRHDF